MFGSEANFILLNNEKFVSWAKAYLVRMAEDVSTGDSGLVTRLREANELVGVDFEAVHWTTFYKHNYETQGRISFREPYIADFLPALHHLYNFTPNIIDHRFRGMARLGQKKKRRKNRRKDLPTFRKFATAWLKRFFHDVVPFPSPVNFMWMDLKKAARHVKSKETFDRLNRFSDIKEADAHTKNKHLRCFIAPLRHIYDNLPYTRCAFIGKGGYIGFSWKSYDKVEVDPPKVSGGFMDLRDYPVDTIVIDVYPLEMESKLDGDGIDPLVLKILTHMLKKGYTGVSGEQLASWLCVDPREFEKWADKNPKLISKPGVTNSHTYYSLKPLDKSKMTMGNPNHTDKCRCQVCCRERKEDWHTEGCICAMCQSSDCDCDWCLKSKKQLRCSGCEKLTQSGEYLSIPVSEGNRCKCDDIVCPYCKQRLNPDEVLKDKDGRYICYKCDKVWARPKPTGLLAAHICDQCNALFGTFKNVSGEYVCPECKKPPFLFGTIDTEDLKCPHCKVPLKSVGSRTAACEQCKEAFMITARPDGSVVGGPLSPKEVDGMGYNSEPVECPHCKEWLNFKSLLSTAKSYFICYKCDKEFVPTCPNDECARTFHPNKSRQTVDDNFECASCRARFKYPNLTPLKFPPKRDSEMGNKSEPVECPHCKKGLVFESLVPTKGPYFVCYKCDKGFVPTCPNDECATPLHPTNLTDKSRKSGMFECPDCQNKFKYPSFTFAQTNSLPKGDDKVGYNSEPVECPHCKERLDFKSLLSTATPYFICYKCDKGFVPTCPNDECGVTLRLTRLTDKFRNTVDGNFECSDCQTRFKYPDLTPSKGDSEMGSELEVKCPDCQTKFKYLNLTFAELARMAPLLLCCECDKGFVPMCPNDKCATTLRLINLTDESRKAGVFECPDCQTKFKHPNLIPDISAMGVPEAAEEHPDIGTDEFDTFITQFLSNTDASKPWRSSDLITSLGYDITKFDEWALNNPSLTRRVSSTSKEKKPKMWYALVSRLVPKPDADEKKAKKKEEPEKKEEEKGEKKKLAGSSITMQELIAFAMVHNTADSFVRTMNFYANNLATRHEEAFSQLTKAQKHLAAAVALLQKGMKVPDNKLPPMTEV